MQRGNAGWAWGRKLASGRRWLTVGVTALAVAVPQYGWPASTPTLLEKGAQPCAPARFCAATAAAATGGPDQAALGTWYGTITLHSDRSYTARFSVRENLNGVPYQKEVTYSLKNVVCDETITFKQNGTYSDSGTIKGTIEVAVEHNSNLGLTFTLKTTGRSISDKGILIVNGAGTAISSLFFAPWLPRAAGCRNAFGRGAGLRRNAPVRSSVPDRPHIATDLHLFHLARPEYYHGRRLPKCYPAQIGHI